jgi:outer membrane protein assembly factor BamD
MKRIITMKPIVCLCLLLALSAAGCAWFETQEEKSATQLAQEGMAAFEREKYRRAIESFEKLRDWYPFSKYASLAELKTADAYYHLEEYDEAVYAYEAFESLHPRNEAIPYVIYQIGRCYYEQMESIDRDQTATKKALDTFQRLKQSFPKSSYAMKADSHIKECYERLAGHEFYVGMFYYKSKHYKTALNRFQTVIEEYPTVGDLRWKARKYIALAKEQIDENASD